MSIYAIKDEDGELRDQTWDSPNITKNFWTYTDINVSTATAMADMHRGSHVVELVEKAEPVEVSKKAGQKLAGLKREADIGDTPDPMYLWVASLREDEDMSIEDIFRALDVGWTVKQPKRWYVKVPKEWFGTGTLKRFYKYNDGGIATIANVAADNSTDEQFTAEEIDKYHLCGFEKVEVEDND